MGNRTSSSNITELKQNEVFVFGSNLSGFHAGGAARAALRWGAVWGQGIGIQGQTYALPTVEKQLSRILTVDEIRDHVIQFIDFAKDNPELTFLVTEIGCGIAGYTVEQIAPLFLGATDVDNIHLPVSFWQVLNHKEA